MRAGAHEGPDFDITAVFSIFSPSTFFCQGRLSWHALCKKHRTYQVALLVKNLPANAGDVKRCGFGPQVWKIPWRRAWQPTPVFLPGESHGQRAWRTTVHGVTESQTRLKWLSTHCKKRISGLSTRHTGTALTLQRQPDSSTIWNFKSYAAYTWQLLSQLLLYPLPTPAGVFPFRHDGGSLAPCLSASFWLPCRWLCKLQAKYMTSPFSTNSLDGRAQGHFNPARCYIFCSHEGKCESINGQCFFLLGDRVGCLMPTRSALGFFFFLDFVSIFAKTGDESINCEIWLQSSDMGVRSDLGDYHLVCGYTCYVVVKATESSWRSTRAGPFREGPVRAGWCGQALWSARGLVSLRVTRPGRVDSICCAVSSTDGQLGALEELLSPTPGRTALLLRGQASVSSE